MHSKRHASFVLVKLTLQALGFFLAGIIFYLDLEISMHVLYFPTSCDVAERDKLAVIKVKELKKMHNFAPSH